MIYLQFNLVSYLIISMFLYEPVICVSETQTQNHNITASIPYFTNIITKLMMSIMKPIDSNGTSNEEKIRVKRQASGAGKFTEAARMPQVKVLRLFLQGFKNFWAPVHVGGSHPFHHEVPKPVVYLFRDKIVEFFFPDVGEEREKKSH